MREPDGAADLRPGAAVAPRDDVDEVLRVVRLRIALVGAEVGSVLEARLRDHPARDEILVGPEAQLEIRLHRLRLLDEAREADRPVRLAVPHLDETFLRQVRGLQEAQLKSPSDHLPEEPRGVQGLRLALVDDDRAVSEEVHDDPPLRPLARPVPPRMRLPHAVIRHVALLVDEAEQERLPDARRLLCAFEELREIEHRPFAQGPHPVAARRLPRGAATRIHLEVDGPPARLHHVSSLPQVAVDEVPDLERIDRRARGAEQLPGGHRAAFPADGETIRLDEVDRLEEIQLEASAGARAAEEPAIVERAAFGRILDHDSVRDQFPRHPRRANGRRAIKGSERMATRSASGGPFRGVYIEAYTMKGEMKRDRLLEETREALAKTGFFLSRPHGERGLSFDLVARRDDTLLIVKVLQNVDALARETAHELGHRPHAGGFAARRRRTDGDRRAGGRRHLQPLRRADPLAAHAPGIPGGRRAAVPLFRAGRPLRATRLERAPTAAGGPPGLPRDARGHRGRLAPHDPDVPRGDVRDDGRRVAPGRVPQRAARPPGRPVPVPRRADGGHPVAPPRRLRAGAVPAARTTRRRGLADGQEPVRCALEPPGDDPADGRRGRGSRTRPEGGGRVEHQPRGREGLRDVRRAPVRPHEHPRRAPDRPGGASPDARLRRCRGDDLREERLMEEVRLGAASVRILPAVRGLSSEAAAVHDAIESMRPSTVGLSIGAEELQALRTYDGGPLGPENFEEEIYVAGLSAWEPPIKPPPCFSEAIRTADARKIRVEALDMDDVTYTENYVDCVSALEVVFQGRLERKLLKKQFQATNPRDFVLEWDAEVNGSPGFARLQARREAFIALRLREIAGSASSVLAVIEVERVNGVLATLRG